MPVTTAVRDRTRDAAASPLPVRRARTAAGDGHRGGTLGARLVAVVLVVLHLVPVNVVPRTLSAVVVGGCVVLLVVALWHDRRHVRVPAGAGLLAAVHLAVLLMIARHGDLTLLVQAVAFGSLGVVVCVIATGDRALDRRLVLRALLLAGLLQVGIGAVQAATRGVPVWGLLGDRTSAVVSSNPLWAGFGGRVVGTMGHPIPMGMLMVACLLLVLSRTDLVARWQRVPLLVTFGVGLGLTGTRSAVIATALGLMALLALRGGRWRPLWRAGLLAAGLWTVMAADLVSLVDRSIGQSFSVTHRLSSVEAVPRLLARPPLETIFGSGYASADDLYARGVLVYDGQLAVDNQLVTVLAEGGLVGLVLFMAFVGWLARRTPVRMVPVLVALLGMSLFFDVLSWPAGWVTVLLLAAPDRSAPTDPPPTEAAPPFHDPRGQRDVRTH